MNHALAQAMIICDRIAFHEQIRDQFRGLHPEEDDLSASISNWAKSMAFRIPNSRLLP